MERIFHRENVIGAGLGLITFCIYLSTLYRSVGYTDSGELAAVICTLGIAHPTGYPLFTVLGRCWVMLPLPWEEILRLNILSAVLVSIVVSLFFKTSIAIARAAKTFAPKDGVIRKWKGAPFVAASAIASLTLGFSTTFWSQSTVLEVYALHLVLILLSILTFISGLEDQLQKPDFISRFLICFAFVLGLSFSNHMTSILLAPGFLWLYFRTFGLRKKSFVRLLVLTPFFLAGLSIYLYLPIRSAAHPLLNWGNPDTLERFFWHVSGKQYRVWMFSGWEVVNKQFKYYLTNFPAEFNAVAIACALVGLAALWRRSKRMVIFLLLLFCSTILYAGLIIAFGIHAALGFAERKGWNITIIVLLFFALPAGQLAYHRKAVEESESALPSRFVKKVFPELEPNAIVLSTQWDYFVSPALYYRYVAGRRRDLIIIDKSLLQDRSWYFALLDRQAPWLMERIGESKRAFLAELRKFEHGEPFNFQTIQACWQTLLADIVSKSIPDHPVYIDARIDKEFPSDYQRTPEGLFLRLSRTDSALSFRGATFPVSGLDAKNPVVKDFEQYFILILLYDAQWLIRHAEIVKAKECLGEVLRIAPGNRAALWMMAQLPR
jgi:hypothetical protein